METFSIVAQLTAYGNSRTWGLPAVAHKSAPWRSNGKPKVIYAGDVFNELVCMFSQRTREVRLWVATEPTEYKLTRIGSAPDRKVPDDFEVVGVYNAEATAEHVYQDLVAALGHDKVVK